MIPLLDAARIGLRRSLADWPIVLAAGIVSLLAATLLAAAPIYADAVATAGLRQVVADAPVADSHVDVAVRLPPADADRLSPAIDAELRDALGPWAADVVRVGRSDSFAVAGTPEDEVADLYVFGSADGIDRHATLIDGAWPADAPADDPIPVAVSAEIANALQLGVDDQIDFQNRLVPGHVVTARIAGIYGIDDPTDPFWFDEEQALEGSTTSANYVTHGPLVTTSSGLVRAVPNLVQVHWRALLDLDRVSPSALADVRTRVQALPGRLGGIVPAAHPVTVSTDLPAILDATERSLLVSQTGVLVLVLQVAVIAAYAVLLSAAVLVDHRRAELATFRSRGAGPTAIAQIAAVEGLLLVVPAVVLGPPLAVIGLSWFDEVGPLADVGLRIHPAVSFEAYLAAAAAGVVCLVALILPPVWAARTVGPAKAGRGRAESRTFAQRLGLDMALVAIAGIGLWQLRHYGAVLTESVRGTIGLDPLLVAAPAIGLLAGAVVALRLVPLLAEAIERASARRRGLVVTLGSQQLARRPLRYTRSALLLTLAMAMGLFAVTFSRTWTTSQQDQATYQVGAAVRVEPSRRTTSLSREILDGIYMAIPGVATAMPVDREPLRATRGTRGALLLGLDATTAAATVRLRDDLAEAPVADLMAPLVAGRPTAEGIRLPDDTTRLDLAMSIDVGGVTMPMPDPETGEVMLEPVDPETVADWDGLSAAVVLRDTRGLIHRLHAPAQPIATGSHQLTVELPMAPDGSVGIQGPLELLAIEPRITLPDPYDSDATSLALEGVTASASDGRATPVALEAQGGWRIDSSDGAVATAAPPDALRVTGRGVHQGGFFDEAGLDIAMRPAALATALDTTLPVLVNDAYLAATAREVGDRGTLPVDGVDRDVVITGAVRAFPTTAPDAPLVIADLPSLQLLRFADTGAVDPAEEWWLDVAPESVPDVVATLRDAPIASTSVVSLADRARSLASDPVALGAIGALAIGFVAASLFAIVGFIVSASVSARERIGEFALLRALGLSPGQLTGWLSLENATLAIVSLVAGTLLGLGLAWLVLPFVTLTQAGGAPIPAADLEVPWTTVALLEVASIAALAATVGALAWLLRRTGPRTALRIGED